MIKYERWNPEWRLRIGLPAPELTDRGLKSRKIWNSIEVENRKQIEKWGIQTRTAFEWLAYTTEELGELAQAISEHHYRNGKIQDVVNEAIQVATLAMKIAEMYDDIQESQAMNNTNNPCGHTGFESNVCEICGYPDPSKMIAALKKQIEDGECCGNCKHYSKRSDCVSKHNMDAHSVCDYWTSDGKTREERK